MFAATWICQPAAETVDGVSLPAQSNMDGVPAPRPLETSMRGDCQNTMLAPLYAGSSRCKSAIGAEGLLHGTSREEDGACGTVSDVQRTRQKLSPISWKVQGVTDSQSGKDLHS